MIPPFNDAGHLPPGLHPATLAEITERFGRPSEIRRVQMESLRWLVDLAVRAGVERIVLNGSFVSDIIEPNDVDCALLMGPDYPLDLAAAAEIEAGLPFLSIDLGRRRPFERMVGAVFATDRHGASKGMVEVVL